PPPAPSPPRSTTHFRSNPYATDYTRYMKPDTSKVATGLYAGLGVFISCTLLEIVGAASVTIAAKVSGNPTAMFTGHLPTWLADRSKSTRLNSSHRTISY